MKSWGDVCREGSFDWEFPGWNSGSDDIFDLNLASSRTSSGGTLFCCAGVGPKTNLDPSESSWLNCLSCASTISTVEPALVTAILCFEKVSDSLSWSVSESDTFSLHFKSKSTSSAGTKAPGEENWVRYVKAKCIPNYSCHNWVYVCFNCLLQLLNPVLWNRWGVLLDIPTILKSPKPFPISLNHCPLQRSLSTLVGFHLPFFQS